MYGKKTYTERGHIWNRDTHKKWRHPRGVGTHIENRNTHGEGIHIKWGYTRKRDIHGEGTYTEWGHI